mmetsp:Transcript_15386/g.51837  ORF Transcript_15386/g.51837 Transcript_15386/m.51837 type:complete len:208 (-) Transcript_15386:679-1302(-)
MACLASSHRVEAQGTLDCVCNALATACVASAAPRSAAFKATVRARLKACRRTVETSRPRCSTPPAPAMTFAASWAALFSDCRLSAPSSWAPRPRAVAIVATFAAWLENVCGSETMAPDSEASSETTENECARRECCGSAAANSCTCQAHAVAAGVCSSRTARQAAPGRTRSSAAVLSAFWPPKSHSRTARHSSTMRSAVTTMPASCA